MRKKLFLLLMALSFVSFTESIYGAASSTEKPIMIRAGASQAATDKEVENLKEKANKGDVSAMEELGAIFLGERHDLPPTIYWYEKAADKGSGIALFVLARIANNLGDLSKKAQLQDKAFIEGVDWALKPLDNMINVGIAGEPSIRPGASKFASKADIRRLQKQARQSDIEAMNELGDIYLMEKQNLQAATMWYQKSANQGNGRALYLLIQFSKHKKNWIKEYKLLEKAASLGYRWALRNAGVKAHELGFTKDAIKWYTLEAEKGNTSAMYLLGALYEHEEKDLPSAIEWYKKAAALGEKDSIVRLNKLEK